MTKREQNRVNVYLNRYKYQEEWKKNSICLDEYNRIKENKNIKWKINLYTN